MIAKITLFFFCLSQLSNGWSQYTEIKESGFHGKVKSIRSYHYYDIDDAKLDAYELNKSHPLYITYNHFSPAGDIDTSITTYDTKKIPNIISDTRTNTIFSYDSNGRKAFMKATSMKIQNDTTDLTEFNYEFTWLSDFDYIETVRQAETNEAKWKNHYFLDKNYRLEKIDAIVYSDTGTVDYTVTATYERNENGQKTKSTELISSKPDEQIVFIHDYWEFDNYGNPTLIVTTSIVGVEKSENIIVVQKEYEYYE